ncbi:MAG: acetylglutamate kinase [Planctomycetota bacterium]
MDQAIAKADTLIEAMGWIRRFRGKTIVIKLGGSLLEDPTAILHLLLDVVFMETVGLRPVVVHGGGKAISREMEKRGITPRFVRGRRVTDTESLEVVRDVLAGEINVQLKEQIEHAGGRAKNLSPLTTCVLQGQKLSLDDNEDLGFVGEVTSVDRDVIDTLSQADQVPVIPSLCLDASGQMYNVNADTAAMAVAIALGAEKLVFLSDVNGVRRDVEDAASIIPALTSQDARDLISQGAITEGMIPKVEACLDTLDRGVQKVHIVDGRLRHSLLLEIFTTAGVGTEIHA